jgi:hypothetical protein
MATHLLHVKSDRRRASRSVRVPELVQLVEALLTGIGGQILVGRARSERLLDVVGACTTKDDNVEERVGSQTVRAVHRHAGGFTGSVETGDDLVVSVLQIRMAMLILSCLKVAPLTQALPCRQ